MDLQNSVFNSFEEPETYRRVDGKHVLDLYFGVDESMRWSLLLVSDDEPPRAEPSRLISAQKGQRADKKWTTSFSLLDSARKDIFLLLCNDIVDSSRAFANKKKATHFIVTRYKEWREMLANSRDRLLSEIEAKGLLGEMYFLLYYLAPKYGADKAVLSWTGPRNLPQDFLVGNTWYEIKTISSSSAEVTISSIEQLDSMNYGELVVVHADKTSSTSDNALNLNQLYKQLLEKIASDSVRAEFCNTLLQYGFYCRTEYESPEYSFEVKDYARYEVGPTFPCLRRKDVFPCIVKAQYSISLPAIREFRKG